MIYATDSMPPGRATAGHWGSPGHGPGPGSVPESSGITGVTVPQCLVAGALRAIGPCHRQRPGGRTGFYREAQPSAATKLNKPTELSSFFTD
eukprot:762701-Hanusia_phi.AAC.2